MIEIKTQAHAGREILPYPDTLNSMQIHTTGCECTRAHRISQFDFGLVLNTYLLRSGHQRAQGKHNR